VASVESYRCVGIGRRMRATKLQHTWTLRMSEVSSDPQAEGEVRLDLVHSRITGCRRILLDGKEVFRTRRRLLMWSFKHNSGMEILLCSKGKGYNLQCHGTTCHQGGAANVSMEKSVSMRNGVPVIDVDLFETVQMIKSSGEDLFETVKVTNSRREFRKEGNLVDVERGLPSCPEDTPCVGSTSLAAAQGPASLRTRCPPPASPCDTGSEPPPSLSTATPASEHRSSVEISVSEATCAPSSPSRSIVVAEALRTPNHNSIAADAQPANDPRSATVAGHALGHASNRAGTPTNGSATQDCIPAPGSPIIYGVARCGDGGPQKKSSRLVAELPPATARHFVEVPVEVIKQPSVHVGTPRLRGQQLWTPRPPYLGRVQSLPPASVVPECTWQWPQGHRPNAARGGACMYKDRVTTVYSAWQPGLMPPAGRSMPSVARASSVPGGAWRLHRG